MLIGSDPRQTAAREQPIGNEGRVAMMKSIVRETSVSHSDDLYCCPIMSKWAHNGLTFSSDFVVFIFDSLFVSLCPSGTVGGRGSFKLLAAAQT